MFCVFVDAAFGNQFKRGLPKGNGWWTKIYSESEPVPVYISQGTRPADWEETRHSPSPARGKVL